MPFTTSSASAMPGTALGLTKDTIWMWSSPVWESASISSILRDVGIAPFSNWNPSRGPSSEIWIAVGMVIGASGRSVAASLVRAGAASIALVRRHRDDVALVDDLLAGAVELEHALLLEPGDLVQHVGHVEPRLGVEIADAEPRLRRRLV